MSVLMRIRYSGNRLKDLKGLSGPQMQLTVRKEQPSSLQRSLSTVSRESRAWKALYKFRNTLSVLSGAKTGVTHSQSLLIQQSRFNSQNTNCNSAEDNVDLDPAEIPHIPVMTEEIMDVLLPQSGQTFVDMTFGGGGHTKAIFERAPGCRVFGLDRDPVSAEIAKEFAEKNVNFVPLFGRFSEALPLLSKHGVSGDSVDGIIFDVGASSMQFDMAHRGFSISRDGPLDMRMDGNSQPDVPSAADVVNHIEENDLYQILRCYGEEKKARLIARAIVDSRYTFGRITTTGQLANIVGAIFTGIQARDKLNRPAHVATKTFQALRIFVNNELNELNNGLELAHHLLRPGGHCAVIAFHSLEDRVAKRHFHNIDMDLKANMSVTDHHRNSAKFYGEQEVQNLLKKRWQPISKKVILPKEMEQLTNPRSRSAKLRVAQKVVE